MVSTLEALLLLTIYFVLHQFVFCDAVGVGYGYTLASITQTNYGEILASLNVTNTTSLYGPDLETLQLTVSYETEDRLRVRITDASNSAGRWEIPNSLIPRGNGTFGAIKYHRKFGRNLRWSEQVYILNSQSFQFLYTVDPFGFAIVRDGETLFNSTPPVQETGIPSFGPMVFKDQYLEISTQISVGTSIYGIGESTRPEGFRLEHNRKYTLWSADIVASATNINLYGSFPFYLAVSPSGKSHGVLLLNSNGMDVTYGDNFLTYRVIGGIFDFYFFAGTKPISVVQQYTELVGRPAPVPYWSLGFHQCKYGYKSIQVLEEVVANYTSAGIPLEVMWSDIDHMDEYRDFTLDPVNYPTSEVQQFVDSLHKNGQKYVLILDPGIKPDTNYSTFVRGLEADVYIKDAEGDPYLGQVWPGPVYFPDFLKPNTTTFWTNEISIFHETIPFDGLWIDMNEASNFCGGATCSLPTNETCPKPEAQTECCLVCNDDNATKWDDPPYHIDNSNYDRFLGGKTIATSAKHYDGTLEYNTHNLYGLSEAIATNIALKTVTAKRPFILSRSTFVGSGRVTAHWTGDNAARWSDLAYSIPGILNSGIFGIPMVGSDICGFTDNTTEELCNRWIQLGAFYPFSRDHSDNNSNRQELYLWESVTKSAKKALGLRYKILPYLYTLFYEAHKKGSPVARPLFFEFYKDPITLGISSQFMLGQRILISPVLTENATTVEAYFPKGSWYNLFNLSEGLVSPGSYHVLQAPLDTINVHVHAGAIIPMQEEAMTTALARKTPFTLLVVFPVVGAPSDDDDDEASGELFLDDGERIEMQIEAGNSSFVKFEAKKSRKKLTLKSKVNQGQYAINEGLFVDKLVILGLSYPPSKITVDGQQLLPILKFELNVLEISGLGLPLGRKFKMRLDLAVPKQAFK